MGLQHRYWIPEGQPPSGGAYVQYPIEDLVGILALESHRHHSLVVGEDLGTVPEGFRERMAEANILSYRTLFFEQNTETGDFLAPQAYPRGRSPSSAATICRPCAAGGKAAILISRSASVCFPTQKRSCVSARCAAGTTHSFSPLCAARACCPRRVNRTQGAWPVRPMPIWRVPERVGNGAD